MSEMALNSFCFPRLDINYWFFVDIFMDIIFSIIGFFRKIVSFDFFNIPEYARKIDGVI